MVTMSKALLKDTFRSIWRTKARFISIILIVALGIGFFAGIKATAPDMKETANRYFLSNNLMDLRVLSTVGFEQADVDAIREIDGVRAVMPAYFADGLVKVNGESLIDIGWLCVQRSCAFSQHGNAGRLAKRKKRCGIYEPAHAY